MRSGSEALFIDGATEQGWRDDVALFIDGATEQCLVNVWLE